MAESIRRDVYEALRCFWWLRCGKSSQTLGPDLGVRVLLADLQEAMLKAPKKCED